MELNEIELKMLQALPLDVKIAKTKQRLREAIDHFGVDHLYLSVSGGIDSTILNETLKEVEEEDKIPKGAIPRVFSNTGNEYDGVMKNARKIADVEVRPKKSFYQVITEEGYPVGSKKVSRMLRDLQNPTERNKATRKLYFEGIKRDGTKTKSFKLPNMYREFIDSAVKCSEKCCYYLKKEPLLRYEKETGRFPIIAVTADEGGTRESAYLKTGCNAFHGKHPQSKPVGFWIHDDMLALAILKGTELPPEYGQIVEVENNKTPSPLKIRLMIKHGRKIKLTTTLEKRTGCVCCTYGVTQEKGENRFQRLKKLDPKRYKFCIYGGEIKDGRLVPKGGLGLGYILDMLGVPYDSEKKIKEQLSIFDSELNLRVKVGDKFINDKNGIITKVIKIDKDEILTEQLKDGQRHYDITFDLPWLKQLIDDGIIRKID